MRTLTEFNRGRVGMMGAVVTVLVVGVAQSFTSVPMLFATPTYYAQFADTGGINTGDKVEIAGVNVGLVRSLAIRGNRVLIGFSLPGKTIGMQSRAAIRTDTILGRKNLEIEPRGSEPLKPNGFLPLAQTTTPYQIYDVWGRGVGQGQCHRGRIVVCVNPCSLSPRLRRRRRPYRWRGAALDHSGNCVRMSLYHDGRGRGS